MLQSLPLISIALFVGLLTACQSAPKTAQLVEPEQNLKVEPSKALQIIEPSSKVVGTANNIVVKEIRASSYNNQLLIQIEVNNNRGRRDAFDYRMRWLDANGLQVIPYSSWDVVSLEGHETSIINLTSPHPEATDFRFEIKSHY
ncbi:MAG: YcfL family protein [Agitococcus sp.]